VAGNITLWEERLSDTASHRWRKACLPGVKARWERRGAAAGPWIHSPLRFGVIEGSTVQGPGAKGTGSRLPRAVDGVKLPLRQVELTDQPPGEQWGYSPLPEGGVRVMDRGYHPAKGLLEPADPGVSVGWRYHPHRLNVGEAGEENIDGDERRRATAQTTHCPPVRGVSRRRGPCLPLARGASGRSPAAGPGRGEEKLCSAAPLRAGRGGMDLHPATARAVAPRRRSPPCSESGGKRSLP
jgi:hypothetical protein